MPDLGFIEFESYDPYYHFIARIGDGDVEPTGGYGGWAPTQRIRRRSLTEWPGNDPLKIDVPVLFDGLVDNTSVEDDIRQLEKMAGLEIDTGEPPLLTFDSAGVVPHDKTHASQNDWVIADLTWGKSDRNQYGHRIRQAVTVHLLLYVEDDQLRDDSSAARRRRTTKKRAAKGKKSKGARVKRYTVKAGDTLSSIAARLLGSPSRWHDIAAVNPSIRDPKALKVGQVIKLP